MSLSHEAASQVRGSLTPSMAVVTSVTTMAAPPMTAGRASGPSLRTVPCNWPARAPTPAPVAMPASAPRPSSRFRRAASLPGTVLPTRLANCSATRAGTLLAGRPRSAMSAKPTAFSAVVPAAPATAPLVNFFICPPRPASAGTGVHGSSPITAKTSSPQWPLPDCHQDYWPARDTRRTPQGFCSRGFAS